MVKFAYAVSQRVSHHTPSRIDENRALMPTSNGPLHAARGEHQPVAGIGETAVERKSHGGIHAVPVHAFT